MIAYNHLWLDNLHIRKQLETTQLDKYVTKLEQQAVNKAYPANFYTPNIFIRIGLFLLTLVIAGFSFALLGLFFFLMPAQRALELC